LAPAVAFDERAPTGMYRVCGSPVQVTTTLVAFWGWVKKFC
jgi:hypothetical protein